jgi:hypothetical protein
MSHSSRRTCEPNGFGGHHCTKLVLHIGEPSIAVSSQPGDELQFSTAQPVVLGAPVEFEITVNDHVLSFDSGPPPCDIVVTLHRLII